VEAEVPSDFALLAEVQGALWLSDKLDDALDTLPEKLYRRLPFSRMRSTIRALMSDPISADEALGKRYRDWKAELQALQRSACNELVTSEAWDSGKARLSQIRGAAGDILEPHRAAVIEGCLDFESGGDLANALQKILTARLNGGKQANWTIPVSEVKAAIKGIRELADAALKTGIVTMQARDEDVTMLRKVRDLRKAYQLVQSELTRVKRQERLLDYADLEVHAIKSLDYEHVRRFYQARWKAFVVDEYQDTNSVQDEILKRLRRTGTRRAIVGDANQSIYGFRRADPGLIDEAAKQILDEGGMLESLDTNYRTHEKLVGEMNMVFTTLFEGGEQPFVPQMSVREAPPVGNDDRWLRVFQVSPAEGSKPPKAHQLRVEAMNIARLLRDMEQAETPVYDKEMKSHRPMQWGDVAIIARTWGSLDPYSDALASIGIPHVHMGGGNLMDTREARDGYVLLRWLADPADDLALAALLKSPFFSVSDLDLYRLRTGSEDGLYHAVQADATVNGPMKRHCELLKKLLEFRKSESPSRLLHAADCETGLSAILLSLPSGERRLADWRGFCSLVTEIEKTSFDAFSVARVLRRLDMAKSDRAAHVEAPRPALEAGNATSLMTVHRSKGLEWPIVVMADLAKAPRRDDSTILFDPKFGVAIRADGVEPAEQPILLRFLRHKTAQREQQEEKWLLYVAATRARDYLLLASTKPAAKSAFAVLEPGLAAACKEIEFWGFDKEDAQPPEPRHVILNIPRPQLCLGSITASPKQIPATSLATYLRCPKQFEYRVVIGHPGIGNGDSIPGRIGTLVHTAIQYNIDSVKVLQRYDRSIEPELVERALSLAKLYRSDGFYTRYRAVKAEFEVPITHRIAGITITGRVDMLGPDFILDFKTGRRSGEAEHLMQLWLYADATDRDEMVICYFDGERPTIRHKKEMPEMQGQVEAILSGIKSREFVAKPDAEKCIWCRYKSICPDSAAAILPQSSAEQG
jgi:ATP-dependent helicase/nuclease subunit A